MNRLFPTPWPRRSCWMWAWVNTFCTIWVESTEILNWKTSSSADRLPTSSTRISWISASPPSLAETRRWQGQSPSCREPVRLESPPWSEITCCSLESFCGPDGYRGSMWSQTELFFAGKQQHLPIWIRSSPGWMQVQHRSTSASLVSSSSEPEFWIVRTWPTSETLSKDMDLRVPSILTISSR